MTDKVESILGFAVRAGKVIYGIDNIEHLRKKRYVMLICNSLSERSVKKCIAVADSGRIPLLQIKNKLLEEIVHKPNCKAVAIGDKQITQAKLKFRNDNYEVLTSEVK